MTRKHSFEAAIILFLLTGIITVGSLFAIADNTKSGFTTDGAQKTITMTVPKRSPEDTQRKREDNERIARENDKLYAMERDSYIIASGLLHRTYDTGGSSWEAMRLLELIPAHAADEVEIEYCSPEGCLVKSADTQVWIVIKNGKISSMERILVGE